ncbi:MAG: hypothetical protein OXI44_11480 [Bacteroidota bacterium]|nr:hypothetical protein [Bacteroidota bacterium]
MNTKQEDNRDTFAEAKRIFEQLGLDQKVEFIATQTLNTAVEAANAIVDCVSEECSEIFSSPAQSTDEQDSAEAETT